MGCWIGATLPRRSVIAADQPSGKVFLQRNRRAVKLPQRSSSKGGERCYARERGRRCAHRVACALKRERHLRPGVCGREGMGLTPCGDAPRDVSSDPSSVIGCPRCLGPSMCR